jgi:plastocyanin
VKQVFAVIACSILAAGLFSACGNAEPAAPAATVTVDAAGNPVGRITVSMQDDIFAPDAFVVPRGVPVEIRAVNDGEAVHNMLVSGPGGEGTAFRTEIRVSAGEESTFEVLFEAPGEYGFSCGFHLPGMTGRVIVQ